MKVRNPFVQGLLLLVAAFSIAVVANAFASRERRLVLPGYYPNAQRVPPRESERVPPTPIAAPATEVPPAATATAPAATPAAAAMDTVVATVPQPATTSTGAPVTASVPAVPTSSPSTASAPPAANPLAGFAAHPGEPFVEISGADAALLHSKGVLFLDARRTSVFEEGHIAGSRSFSVWESDVDDKVNGLFGERSSPEQQNLPIVVYCSGGACEDSHMLAQKLWGIQFNNVYVYTDGFPDWQKRGGAIRTGGQP